MDAVSRYLLPWLQGLAASLPESGVVAYNFNIAETLDAFEIELVGSTYFDAASADWACEEAWTSRPSRCLIPYAEVGRQWEPFLGSLSSSLREVLSSRSFGTRRLWQADAVTVGFVDGDLVRVGGGGADV